MKQSLRITYDESDYNYQIVNETPITNTTLELQIKIEGTEITLVRDQRKIWITKEEVSSLDPGLLQAIGRTVSLRFRL